MMSRPTKEQFAHYKAALDTLNTKHAVGCTYPGVLEANKTLSPVLQFNGFEEMTPRCPTCRTTDIDPRLYYKMFRDNEERLLVRGQTEQPRDFVA